jgi:hypothetical protein
MNNSTIFDWIEVSTVFDDQHIIRENQSGPRPERPFITYELLSLVPSDFSTPQKIEDPGDPDNTLITYYNRARLSISVNVYAENGEEILAELNQSTELLVPRLTLRDGNLALIGMSSVRNLTELGDVGYRPRFQADFDFRWFSTVAESIQRIREYTIGGVWKHKPGELPAESLPVVVETGVIP